MTKHPIEVITSVERRRRWSRDDKERLVAACLEPYAASPPHGFFGCSDLTAISAVK
jgi:transposase-like protein